MLQSRYCYCLVLYLVQFMVDVAMLIRSRQQLRDFWWLPAKVRVIYSNGARLHMTWTPPASVLSVFLHPLKKHDP